jgi:hypothetical protein
MGRADGTPSFKLNSMVLSHYVIALGIYFYFASSIKRFQKRSSTHPWVGLFPRRLSQIAFQSCITAHWRNGLYHTADTKMMISYS